MRKLWFFQVLTFLFSAAAFLPACEPACKNQALPLGKAHLLQEMEKEIEQAYPSYPKPYQIKFDTAAMEGPAMVCWGDWRDYLVSSTLLVPDTSLCDYALFQNIYFEGPNPSTVFFDDFQTFSHFVNSLDRQPILEELDFYMYGVFRLFRKDDDYMSDDTLDLFDFTLRSEGFFFPDKEVSEQEKESYEMFLAKKEELIQKIDSIQYAHLEAVIPHFYTSSYYNFIVVFESYRPKLRKRGYVFLLFFPHKFWKVDQHPHISIFE